MTHKAVGIETGTIYATGTHQQCVRAVNERISNTGQVDGIGRAVTLQQTEAIRIYRAGQQFETDAEYLERMEKEMRLLEIQAEQRKQEKAEQRKQERIRQREMEAKARREQQEELRLLKAEQKRRERAEIARFEAEQKAAAEATRKAEAEDRAMAELTAAGQSAHLRAVAFCRLADAIGIKLTKAQLAALDAFEGRAKVPA